MSAPTDVPDSRELPVNYEAEQAVLAAVLADNRALDLIDGLEPEHFSEPAHGRIFAACRALANSGAVASILGAALRRVAAIEAEVKVIMRELDKP